MHVSGREQGRGDPANCPLADSYSALCAWGIPPLPLGCHILSLVCWGVGGDCWPSLCPLGFDACFSCPSPPCAASYSVLLGPRIEALTREPPAMAAALNNIQHAAALAATRGSQQQQVCVCVLAVAAAAPECDIPPPLPTAKEQMHSLHRLMTLTHV